MSTQHRHEAGALLVGIDIGGTKTHLRAQPVDKTHSSRTRDRVIPSAGWRRRSWSADARSLLELVRDLADGCSIAAVGVGAHGCDDEEECAAFAGAFAVLTEIPVAVVNDAELMPLALGLPGQTGLVAGTGSIAVCRPAGRGMMSAGGWGWVIGDEGSAAGLVREAAKAVALHIDQGGSCDEPLAEALTRALSIPSISRLGSALATLGSSAAVGAHAEAVFGAAAQGSGLAREVIRDGGRALAELVGLLDSRGSGARHVVAGGSVIVAQPLLWQSFATAVVERTAGRITPHLFVGNPVEGACRLAESIAETASS